MLIQMIISCCRCNTLSICTVYLSSWLSMQSILSISRHLCMGMTRKFIFYNRIKETQECCKHLFFYTFMYPRNNQKTSYIALRSISISGLLIKIGQPMKIYVFPYYGSCNKFQIMGAHFYRCKIQSMPPRNMAESAYYQVVFRFNN